MPSFSFLGKNRMSDDFLESPKPWTRHIIHCLDFEGSRRSGIVEYGIVSFVFRNDDDGMYLYNNPDVGDSGCLWKYSFLFTNNHGARYDSTSPGRSSREYSGGLQRDPGYCDGDRIG